MEILDCIIVGGGPAGLNAAVVLGRCRRKVVLFDSGKYRNQWSHGMHNYLTQDGILPLDFIEQSRAEIAKYGVELIAKKVVDGRQNKEGIFVVKDEDGTEYRSKYMLIATGLMDKVPPIKGFKEMYGKSVFHCPYCDGWEVRDKKLGVYAKNKNGWELALALKGWSDSVVLYTDGKNKVRPSEAEFLEANGVPVNKLPIDHLQGTNGQLEKVVFKNGTEEECDALFFVNGYDQHCDLLETFGCTINKKGVAVTNLKQQTRISGLYIAGDAARDMHFVVVAASEGAKAGVMINRDLQKDESEKKLRMFQNHNLEADA